MLIIPTMQEAEVRESQAKHQSGQHSERPFQKKARHTVRGSSEAKPFPSTHKARDLILSATYKDEIKFDCIKNYTNF